MGATTSKTCCGRASIAAPRVHVDGSPFDMDELDGKASGLLIAE